MALKPGRDPWDLFAGIISVAFVCLLMAAAAAMAITLIAIIIVKPTVVGALLVIGIVLWLARLLWIKIGENYL